MTEATTQEIGREFVRQYYTILHEAPELLYRFYSDDSLFIHDKISMVGEGKEKERGSDNGPFIGQEAIMKRRCSKDLKGCRVKIRQIDSQISIAGSIIILVSGDLSTSYFSCRKFMQTFILAPKSPKKYYIHNDILRYQDEVFSEIEKEENAGVEDGFAQNNQHLPSENYPSHSNPQHPSHLLPSSHHPHPLPPPYLSHPPPHHPSPHHHFPPQNSPSAPPLSTHLFPSNDSADMIDSGYQGDDEAKTKLMNLKVNDPNQITYNTTNTDTTTQNNTSNNTKNTNNSKNTTTETSTFSNKNNKINSNNTFNNVTESKTTNLPKKSFWGSSFNK